MICETATMNCRPLYEDGGVPGWPRFSPNGNRIAFVTQANVGRLGVIPTEGGTVQWLGDARYECPPAWSAPDRVWGLGGTEGRYVWLERNVATGAQTGSVLRASSEDADPAVFECWSPDRDRGSQFERRVRIRAKQDSRLIRVPQPGSPQQGLPAGKQKP
jgi:hypothetical protein